MSDEEPVPEHVPEGAPKLICGICLQELGDDPVEALECGAAMSFTQSA